LYRCSEEVEVMRKESDEANKARDEAVARGVEARVEAAAAK
jgi:hypothetical protein